MVDVRDDPRFSRTQHCTAEDCYTFSHTANYCDRPQPRFCMCAFDYEEGTVSNIDYEGIASKLEAMSDPYGHFWDQEALESAAEIIRGLM